MLPCMSIDAGPATLNILDPDLRFNSPQILEAAERYWYAQTSLGIAVLRYEDCLAMLKDRRLRQVGPGAVAAFSRN